MTAEKFDVYSHVTNQIIAQIEAGTPPWRKPWTGEKGGAPFPLRSNGEPYSGINVLLRRPKVLPPPPRPKLKFHTTTTSSAPAGISTIEDAGTSSPEEAS